MDPAISFATNDDLLEITALVNSAYRGNEARKGWTHEADLIEGSLRTDVDSLKAELSNPNAVILKYTDHQKIIGTVFLEKIDSKLYLGMLSVLPDIQARGIGRKLLQASENYAREQGCQKIEMTVISVRKELIAWYERNGYQITGETRPFHDDGRFGIPRQKIEFIVMEKEVGGL